MLRDEFFRISVLITPLNSVHLSSVDPSTSETYHLATVPKHVKSDPRVKFGKAVRALRMKRGLSQERLAELAEIHRTYIGDVERGTRNISLINMCRISEALSISLSTLIQEMERSR